MTNEEIKKMIVEELKKEGLEIGEDAAISTVKVLLGILKKVVITTENKYDDIALVILPVIEPAIFAALDKIDGKIEE